ncbi:hypothetical protein WMY93_029944 [Mugilogobius chulae]|uniref:BACK domain-containing protein n=1 Tax=Mugilogobius chulae TaxID=88201 RepID=A0AAW0MME0_9GOBI
MPVANQRCVMSGADVEVYLSQVHDGSVSSGFRALYEERLLLDVTLMIEEHHFQAAMYVQLTEAVEFCCSFLLAKICLENCAEVMRLLEDFSVGVEGVQEQLDSFLLENFVPLMNRPDFLSYLSLERLQAYLNSDALSRFPEIELYEAVQSWLRHDRRRWRHTDTIVQSLRFCLMSPANIFEKVKTSEFYRYSRQLRQEVEVALSYFHDVNQQPLVESRSNRIRSVRPQTAVWWELEGPQVPLRPDCLAIVNNFAFLLGGEELGPDGEFHASSKVYRYDPDRTRGYAWPTCLCPVCGGRDREIHLRCGRSDARRDVLLHRTLHITEDRWEFVDPYPVNKYGHEGTVLNGKLYITGGITSSSTSKQVCVFDPGREAGSGAGPPDRPRPSRAVPLLSNSHGGGGGGCWENKSKMNYARCFHKMISHNGKLYVFGGVCVILRASFESQGCPSTEVYDPQSDEWTILASMPIGRSGHGVAVLDRQIMVLGGLCYNGHYSDSILTFDPDDNKWKEDEYPRMPCKLDGLQVCSLHFPEYVLEHVRRCS